MQSDTLALIQHTPPSATDCSDYLDALMTTQEYEDTTAYLEELAQAESFAETSVFLADF